MKSTTLLLTVLATLSIATSGRYVAQDAPLTPSEVIVDEVVQAARGFFIGFNSGLYKVDKVDEQCLSKDAEAKIIELFDAVFSGKLDLNFMMKIVTDFMTITQSIEACGTKTFTDLASFCFFDSANNCSPDKLIENVQKNLLIILGKLTDVSTLVMQGIPKDSEGAYNMGEQAGTDIGSLIRILVGFHSQ